MELLTLVDNNLKKSISLDLMSKAFMLMDKKQPGITFNDAPPVFIHIKEKAVFFAEANSFKSPVPQAPTEPNWISKKDSLAVLEKNSVCFIKTKTSEYSLYVFENGSLEIKELVAPFEWPKYQNKTEKSVDHWMKTGNTGVSSKTLAHVLTGYPISVTPDKYSHPKDVADFRRCVKFLDAVPEARLSLGKMKKISREWSVFVDNWTDLENRVKTDSKESLMDAGSVIRLLLDPTKKPSI